MSTRTKTRRMLALLVVVLTAAAAAVVVLPASGPAAGFEPSCSAVTKRLPVPASKPTPPQKFNVGFRIRCNFRIERLSFRSSKRLVRVQRQTTLERSDPGDRLSCSRRSRSLARCTGDVGERVRVVGAFKVRGSPCGSERLRTRFRVFGGEDCDPPLTACTGVAYTAVARVKHPRGCG